MTFYVYCDRSSTGANELAVALGGYRLRREEGGRFFRKRTASRGRGAYPVALDEGDVIVCWGSACSDVNGVHVLNNARMVNKFTAAQTLKDAGVPTVEVCRTRPAQTPIEDYLNLQAGRFNRAQLTEIRSNIERFLSTAPATSQVEWLARSNSHIGGNDLLRPGRADYYSKKIDLGTEYRIHVFDGKSIRAGMKVHREGVREPHPWIRSYDGGWTIRYDGFESTKKMREIAAEAVKALGLTFGAVDIGKKSGSNDMVVLEVNRAAGLEGNTTQAYASAIQRWYAED